MPLSVKPAGHKYFHGNQSPQRGTLPWILLPAGRPLTHFQGNSWGVFCIIWHICIQCVVRGIVRCLRGLVGAGGAVLVTSEPASESPWSITRQIVNKQSLSQRFSICFPAAQKLLPKGCDDVEMAA